MMDEVREALDVPHTPESALHFSPGAAEWVG